MARSSESDRIAVVEEALRALASASGAVRLYPPSSPIRDDAVRRAAEAMLAMVVEGPVRLVVDRERFLLDGVPVGAGRPATAALAEALHALQIGQVIVAPGLTQGEVGALLDVLSRDAREVRATGGARAALVEAGAQNLAVVEVSLRTSDQQGLAGVDLVTAPLGDIAQHLPAAAERWRSSSEDGDGLDEIASAVDGIEPAMRDLALTRIAQSLLHLDERSRIALVEAALTRTANGRPMEGMLAALAKMPPAALARLLRLVAEQRETGADSLLQEIPLPTQMLREVRALVQPVPAADPARGVPETVDVLTLAAEASPDESDQLVVESLVRQATPAAAAERALVACLEVFGRKRDAESLKAVAEAAVRSLRAGSVEHLREAIVAASAAVAAPDLAPQASAAVRDLAREVLDAAVRFDAEQRMTLLRAATSITEQIAAVASAELASGDERRALAAVQVLLGLGDKRLVALAARALDHPTQSVRVGTLRALAEVRSPEAAGVLAAAVQHRDAETRLAAVREIVRAGLDDAMASLLKVLAEDAPLRRNHELKLEILASIEHARYKDARDAVARIASRKPLLKRSRQLVQRAREVLAALEDEQDTRRGGPRD